MSERTRELESEVEELRRKVEFLERRVVATENERGKSAAQIPVSPGPSAEDVPYARPFEVDYDPEDGEYYIFAPPGCVLVDGHEVEIADVDTESHTVSLDCLDPNDMPDALYAHVTQDASSTGGYKVEFDDEDTKEGALFNFRVCRFGSSENDGNQYDICTSCVTLGAHMLHPYEVRWAQSENEGEGAWVIWFPTEQTYKNIQNPVLMVDTIRIPASGVTDAGTLPLGWKILPNAAAGGDVWLRVDVPRGAGLDDPSWTTNISAAFKTQDDTPPYNPTDLYTHYAIPIAKAYTDQNSGAKLVRQYVTSLVKLSVNTDKEGGDGGGEEDSTPQPFDIDNDVVVRCYAPAPCGTMLVGANYAIDGTKGDILVHVDRNSQTGAYTLSVNQTHRAESPTHHEWTLYQYQGGDVVCDCRPRVLPLIRFDDKSLDIDATNHNLQIKGFDTGTPAATTTIAQDINSSNTNAQSAVVSRTKDGELNYKKIGTLAQLLGSTVAKSAQKILTGLTWSTTSHELVISSANITIANGVITSWTDNADAKIATTSISSIIPS